MDNTLLEIKKYIDTCQNCALYQHGKCGFIFQNRHDFPEGKCLSEEQYYMMDDYERKMYSTQWDHTPCEDQLSEISFLNHIDDMLENADCYFTGTSLTRFAAKCYKLQQKVDGDDFMFYLTFGSVVTKAIARCIAYVDYESLMHNENIIRFIKGAGLEYTRKNGLYTIFQESLAIPLIEKAMIVDVTGCSSSRNSAKYNPETEDVDDVETSIEPSSIDDIPDFDSDDNFSSPDIEEPDIDVRNMTAVEEFIYRYGGHDGRRPLTVLLVKAGYVDYTFGVNCEELGITPEEWAQRYSHDWKRYEFNKWDEMKDEICYEIKKRITNDLELKKYICELLTPFDRFEYYARVRYDVKEMVEAEMLIYKYSQSFFTSSELFLSAWKRAIEMVRDRDSVENLPIDDYRKIISEYIDDELDSIDCMQPCPEAIAFNDRLEVPYRYAHLIAGCLLAEGARLEYLDYQEMCGVDFVDEISAFSVAHEMGWTEELVLSYNPKRIKFSPCISECINEEQSQDNAVAKVGVHFGDISKLPKMFQSSEAIVIWEKTYSHNFIDSNFRFKGKKQELSLFAAKFSLLLFGKIDWISMQEWNNYKYYAKTYGEVSAKPDNTLSPRLKEIIKMFE